MTFSISDPYKYASAKSVTQIFSMLAIVVFLVLLLDHCAIPCIVKYEESNNKILDIYWINMERSTDRKVSMERHFNFYRLANNHRVQALTPHQIFLPKEISIPQQCKQLSVERKLELQMELPNHVNNSNPTRVFVSSHCGRPKNGRKELAVTTSHLHALYQAIQSVKTPYALIMEDDLQFAHEIDFAGLIASAPEDFVMLQLITSSDHALRYLWKVYSKQKVLWLRHKDSDDYWCAGAYLVKKQPFQTLLASIFTPLTEYNTSYELQLVAGYKSPCTPKHCCAPVPALDTDNNNTTTTTAAKLEFVQTGACIKAARGYQADHYLFSLFPGRTYMLSVPVLRALSEGNQSTLHQHHVTMHQVAFQRMEEYLHSMSASSGVGQEKETAGVKHPGFVNTHCAFQPDSNNHNSQTSNASNTSNTT